MPIPTELAAELPHHLLPDRVALIAPPSRGMLAQVLPRFDFGDGTDLSSLIPTRVVGRERDPYRPEPLDEVAGEWSAPAITLPGEGHLNHEDGHGPWPAALAWTLTGDDLSWKGGAG